MDTTIRSCARWSVLWLAILGVILAGCDSSATTHQQAATPTPTPQQATPTSAPSAPPTVYFGGGTINSNSVVPAAKVYALNPANGSVRWSKSIGMMYGMHLNAAGSDVYATDMLGTIIALNTEDGSQLWQVKGHNAVDRQPAADGSAIYIGSSGSSYTHGYVDAYSATNGKKLWERDLGLLQSPDLAIAQGILYVSTQNTLAALHATDGSALWKISIPWPAPSPYIIGNTVYLNFHGDVRAYNAADGTLKWHYTPTSQSPIGDSSVSGVAGLVFAGNGETITALRAADGTVAWNATLRQTFYDTSAYNNVVYAAPGNVLVALDAQTGKQLWSVSLAGNHAGAPLLSNGALFESLSDTMSSPHVSYIYGLSPKDGSVLWKFTRPSEAFTNVAIV